MNNENTQPELMRIAVDPEHIAKVVAQGSEEIVNHGLTNHEVGGPTHQSIEELVFRLRLGKIFGRSFLRRAEEDFDSAEPQSGEREL